MFARITLILSVLCAGALRADDSFTKSLSPEDFQAAGLSKLSPEELARLDALVRGEKTKVTQETAKVVEAQVTQVVTQVVTQKVTEEVRKQVQEEDKKAEQKKAASAGFLDRMKVVLKPGTEIEYTAMDETLIPPFKGWSKGTVFTLSNGQRWMVTDDASYWASKVDKPLHVRLVPGVLGTFFMEIEKGGRPRVRYIGLIPGASPTPDAPAAK